MIDGLKIEDEGRYSAVALASLVENALAKRHLCFRNMESYYKKRQFELRPEEVASESPSF